MDTTPAEPPPRRRRRWSSVPPGVVAAAVAIAGLSAAGGTLLVHGAAGSTPRRAQLTSSTSLAPTGAAPGAQVTVSATGVVTGRPDTLTLQIGASTSAATATGALDQNNTEIAALETVLQRSGVTRSDMQTSGLSLQATYDQSGQVTGYEAADELTVTFHALDRAGAVIDAAAHAVGNDVHIDGIAFSISNTSALLDTARIRAVRAAEAKAEAFATAAGARLGPVHSINDQEQLPPPVFQVPGYAANLAAGPTRSVPLQAGSQQLSVQVRIVYELRG
ncbi:MAG TPA: SIMPL domain-containing protein [Acidimicrobiales bacterium]|nr:SIMPL domain-containing protein [Acidimicrobiales bacterium]